MKTNTPRKFGARNRYAGPYLRTARRQSPPRRVAATGRDGATATETPLLCVQVPVCAGPARAGRGRHVNLCHGRRPFMPAPAPILSGVLLDVGVDDLVE